MSEQAAGPVDDELDTPTDGELRKQALYDKWGKPEFVADRASVLRLLGVRGQVHPTSVVCGLVMSDGHLVRLIDGQGRELTVDLWALPDDWTDTIQVEPLYEEA